MRASLAIVVLLLAGCGGGNSRTDFVADATDICASTNSRVKALGTPDSFTSTQLYARQARDAVGDAIAALEELQPPEELDEAFAQYLKALAERRTVLGRMAEAADANSMKRIQAVGSELDAVNGRARTEAGRAGIAVCEPG